MSNVMRAPDLLDKYTKTKSKATKKTRQVKKPDKQQVAKDFLANFEEHCLPNSDETDKADIYNKVKNLLLDEIEVSSKSSQTVTKSIKITPEKEESVYEDEEDISYNEAESPEIINAFLNLVVSVPITPEQNYSIYNDEELDDF